MKVLILRGTTREINNDSGWYFHLMLEERKIEHDIICHSAFVNTSLFICGINRVFRHLTRGQRAQLINRFRQADQVVLEYVEDHEPDLIMAMSGKTIRPCLLQQIREISPRSILVNVFWDNPFFYDITFSAIPEYDVFFVKDTYVLQEMQKLGADNVAYLHHACYPGEHRPLDDITPAERAEYACDLAFVGSMYPYRARILDVFRDMDLKIWGGEPWGNISCDSVAYTKHQHERVWGREKAAIFNLAKINLNTQHYQNDIFSVSSKVHQVAASGGFQLVDYKPDLLGLYEVGSEIVVFRSREELRGLAEYYLQHPGERAQIAARAHQRALAQHTYAHRFDQILTTVGLA
jgi:spore maturation protein CgeB